jgi:hypothetical protein
MEACDPRVDELLTEMDHALSAIADWCRASLESPPNMERMGVARDQIEASRDAIREMQEQGGRE